MILSPASLADALLISALIASPNLTVRQQHVLEDLRANARGEVEHRADGSRWAAVAFADADLDGLGDRASRHFAALRAAGLFEPVGVAGGNVLLSHAAEVHP